MARVWGLILICGCILRQKRRIMETQIFHHPKTYLNMTTSGDFLPNFDLPNMISTYKKGFFMEKRTHICQIYFSKKNKIQIARFL
jgi:Zn-dependent alcohol dehydrogenase